MRVQFIVMSVVGALAVSGCSGGGMGGSPPISVATASPIVKTFTFPEGDAKTPTSGTAFDIIQVRTTLSSQYYNANHDMYDFLTIETTFAQDISTAFPSPGTSTLSLTPSQLSEVVFFDTGGTAKYPDCGTTSNRNSYISIPGLDASDNYPIEGSNAVLTNQVHGSTLLQTVPLGGINVHAGPAVPRLNLTVGVSNGKQGPDFFTDCASTIGNSTFIGS